MARKYWWPVTLADQLALMLNVLGKIAGHQVAIGITVAQRDRIILICNTFIGAYNYVESCKGTAGSLPEWRDDIFYRKDIGASAPAPPPFAAYAPTLGSFVGCVNEFKATRDMIVEMPGCTEAIAQDLGFVGEESADKPAADVKPTVKVTPAKTGYMASVVVSNRGEANVWEAWTLNKGAAGWVKIGTYEGKSFDITFTPTTPGEPYMFQLHIQLRKNNTNYGQPSDAVTVTVNP